MKHDHRIFGVGRLTASAAYGGTVEDRVRRFQPMVRAQAWHLHGSGRAEFDLEDLMQAGLVALTECAQRHDAPNEDGFAAYAKIRVRGAMVDLIRRSCAGTRGASERRRRIDQATSALRSALGRDPTPSELAAHMELPLAEFEALRDAAQPVSFEPIDDAYNDTDSRFSDSGPNGLEALLESELREELIAQIASLPERLQMVIQLYFIEELSLSDIAEVMGVSIPRIHQLKARALETLREGLQDLVEVR